jgi:hypothetical protein
MSADAIAKANPQHIAEHFISCLPSKAQDNNRINNASLSAADELSDGVFQVAAKVWIAAYRQGPLTTQSGP